MMQPLLRARYTVFAGLLWLLASAQVAVANAEHPAQAMMRDTIGGVSTLLNTEGERIDQDPEYLFSQVQQRIVPLVDFNAATALAVGKFWRQASQSQRASLRDEFQTLLIRTYANAIKNYGGEQIEFLNFRPEKRDDRAEVRTVFKPASGKDIPVTYKLRLKSDDWLVYDIIVDNLSLVTTYRGTFSSEIDKNGIDGLIANLKQKNAG